jgi:hypothetical protein
LLLAGGIWGAYLGQGSRRSRVSGVATVIASIGYLLLVYPPIAVIRNPSIPYAEFVGTRPVLMAAGLMAALGVTLFGAAALRSRTYPAWIGLTCMVSPVVFLTVVLTDGPALVGFAANTLLGSSFVAIGALAPERRIRPTPGDSLIANRPVSRRDLQ